MVLQFPVRLAKDGLVQALEHLLREAKAGQLAGLAYVALEQDMEYTADVVGAALHNRVLALTVVQKLGSAIADLEPALIP